MPLPFYTFKDSLFCQMWKKSTPGCRLWKHLNGRVNQSNGFDSKIRYMRRIEQGNTKTKDTDIDHCFSDLDSLVNLKSCRKKSGFRVYIYFVSLTLSWKHTSKHSLHDTNSLRGLGRNKYASHLNLPYTYVLELRKFSAHICSYRNFMIICAYWILDFTLNYALTFKIERRQVAFIRCVMWPDFEIGRLSNRPPTPHTHPPPTALPMIEQKLWNQQPSPLMSQHSTQLTPFADLDNSTAAVK